MTHRFLMSLTLLLGLAGFRAAAQQQPPLGNEWIDYSKTYVKIKFGPGGPGGTFPNFRPKDAIIRISKGGLDQVGMPASVTGATMSLWCNGQEVPIYVTTTGTFGNSDYIEFYGEHADGRLDSLLYDDHGNLPNPNISMFTDTAVYFLTWDTDVTGAHLRFNQAANNIPATPPAPLPYCWGRTSLNYKSQGGYVPGDFTSNITQFYSSEFTAAEGYIQTYRTPPAVATINVPTPEAVGVAGVDARLNTSLITMSQSGNTSTFTVSMNGTQIADSSWGNIATAHFRKPITSSSLLPTGNNVLAFNPGVAGTGLDYYGVSRVELEYPRSFAVNAPTAGAGYFEFSLDASSTSQYVEVTAFANAANTPRLYDLTNRKYYLGDLSQTGKVRYYLDPSVQKRRLVMYSENNTSNLLTLVPEKLMQFTDYSQPSRQGDYMIITSSALEAITNGHNYVQDYVDYRKSATGGNHNVAKIDAEDLYDQFAYGAYMHPIAIRRMVRYAYDNWTLKPDYLYFIGRGLSYYQHRTYAADPTSYSFPVVPTYGFPGSDVAFSNFLPGRKQALKTGRLSVWKPSEIGTYLDKLKAYEQNLAAIQASPDLASEYWKKQVIHIAGGSNPNIQAILLGNLSLGESEIVKPCMGAQVHTFAKSSTDPVEQAENAMLDNMITNGVSILTFHGHASQNTFDYNLNDPSKYNNSPKLPLFLALGCDVAQMFSLSSSSTITEQWVLQQGGGAMTMIAADNIGFTDFHARYITALYSAIASKGYGLSIGEQHRMAYDSVMTQVWDGTMTGNSGKYYAHLESMLLVGDPAVRLPMPALPDYFVGSANLAAIPAQVTSDDDSFKMRITTFNLGKAGCGGSDSVTVRVEHLAPGGATATIGSYRISSLHVSDTVTLNVNVNSFTDLGLNRYRVTVDADEQDAETSEANNVAYLDLFIASDRLMPVYPKEFAIVYQQGVTLKASTLDPFRPRGRYRFQLDTTMMFNSDKFREHIVEGPGGVIRWQPDNFLMADSMVYYWRTAVDTSNGQDLQWTTSSFVFLQNGSPGWNQSHYFQWLRDDYNNLTLQSTDRQFTLPQRENLLEIRNTVAYQDADGSMINIFLNGTIVQGASQDANGSIQIMAIDPLSGEVRQNTPTDYDGTLAPVFPTRGIFATEFNLDDSIQRQRAAAFLNDSIPDGYYVAIKNIVSNISWGGTDVTKLQNDANYFPATTTLYNRLRNDYGFDLIDQWTGKKAFIFWRRKGAAYNATKQEYINSGAAGEHLIKSFTFVSYPDTGTMVSTVIGPALEWKTMRTKRYTKAPATAANDDAVIRVSGIAPGGGIVPLFTTRSIDTSIAGISATQYPSLRLEWIVNDSVERNSPQQRYWQVLYSPVPEAALNPGAYLSLTDTTNVGQVAHIGVGIENLTEVPMDSMLVRYRVINNGGGMQDIAYKRFRPLPGNDTLHADLDFAPDALIGRNLLFVEANPNNDQPEQYHPNNLGYIPFSVGQDLLNPLLDVTFDGAHILNRDIVSSKPFIKILMRDENKFLPLDDTSLLSVQLRYPGAAGQTVNLPFDNTIMKFFPAQANSANEARIEYRPTLTEDGIYELIVNGKDKSGNIAARTSYRIEFEVVNKSTITNVLNYPNPFSTATSFVFTLTGSQVPSQFKIQILSMTGKVVREITRDELGPIRIGRNMTEYKWDGKDQYGQMLGNGTYLYRVVTTINGQEVEQRTSGADKFFKNGYGKLYIMR